MVKIVETENFKSAESGLEPNQFTGKVPSFTTTLVAQRVTITERERLAPRRLGQNKLLSASRLGDSALILDFTELPDTTAAGPVHVLSALKLVMNETYCLIHFKSSTRAPAKPTSATVWPGP